jgi:hypothetical protein
MILAKIAVQAEREGLNDTLMRQLSKYRLATIAASEHDKVSDVIQACNTLVKLGEVGNSAIIGVNINLEDVRARLLGTGSTLTIKDIHTYTNGEPTTAVAPIPTILPVSDNASYVNKDDGQSEIKSINTQLNNEGGEGATVPSPLDKSL